QKNAAQNEREKTGHEEAGKKNHQEKNNTP
ncbi:MAG: hypothetical protein JWQ78_1590, partial [Sediminibacterium sp.]|nr:hypothetical protein [Sediminibacterium sp.]